jgi:uncharacterized protein YlzI (FlbEa/FlbD family)
MIAGFIYLIDSEGTKVYGKKYISKADRNRIIEKIIKFYGLQNRSFMLQIAPYVN